MFHFSNKKALGQELRCKVLLLVPGEELELPYTINSTGRDVFEDVARELDLLDKDYFGLKLHNQVQWLDMSKLVIKQTKNIDNVILELRFKYYPADPPLLANESTRYYLYLQLRLDLIEGRLRSDSNEDLSYLIACVLQSELGDYSSSTKQENYVTEFKFVPNQTDELELEAIELHKSEDFLGLKPADSELNFLKKACQLETYGIDPYPVKEGSSHNHFLIGVNHRGISTFQGFRRTHQFAWDEIDQITLDNKLVLIYCIRNERKGEKTVRSKALFGFRCPSQAYAQNFWKLSTEHRYFFTLEQSPNEPIVRKTGGLFKKSKLKYTGRVEKDLLRDTVDESRSNGVKRSHSLMSKTSDGPRWQGFQQGKNLQGSLNNIYTTDYMNKTSPPDMEHLREEDEDQILEEENDRSWRGTSVFSDQRKVSSSGLPNQKNQHPSKTFTRRSVLTSKSDNANMAMRRPSNIYADTESRNSEFIRLTIFLAVLMMAIIVGVLLMDELDRPNSLTLMVKRMNLESFSRALRKGYYLPGKSIVEQLSSRISSALRIKLY